MSRIRPTSKVSDLDSAEAVVRTVRLPREQIIAISGEPERSYRRFEQPKKSGGVRVIHAPQSLMRHCQRALLEVFYGSVRFPPWMTGSLPGRSSIDHARVHVGQDVVATVDIADFFPSVSGDLVRRWLDRMGAQPDAIDLVLRLVTLHGALPQGAVTSAFLANFVLYETDKTVERYCRKHELRYSRYMDDIAISGANDVKSAIEFVRRSIGELGLRLNERKICIMPRSERQVVTGLVVNDRLRSNAEYREKVDEHVQTCLDGGSEDLAAELGLSIEALRHRLIGQVRHIARFDSELGKRWTNRLRGVPWRCSAAALRAAERIQHASRDVASLC